MALVAATGVQDKIAETFSSGQPAQQQTNATDARGYWVGTIASGSDTFKLFIGFKSTDTAQTMQENEQTLSSEMDAGITF